MAQRCDDICSSLMLLIEQSKYCRHKSSAVQQLRDKITQCESELSAVLAERDRCFAIVERRRQKSLARVQAQQERELEAHDAIFEGELPVRYRHVSAEVLQIREQERFLRQARRYIEAQQMLEEADALEAFEIERQKVRWHNEGVAIREAMVQQHQRETQCILDKYEQQWVGLLPDSIERENHWRAVIASLERRIAEEKGSSAEVERTTRGMLATDGEKLPPLGKGVIPIPMRRAAFTNSKRAYSVGRVERRTLPLGRSSV
jgi:hypothetical protein